MDELRRIVANATPGEWTEQVLGSEGYLVRAPAPEGQIRARVVARCGHELWEVDKANAEFIATFDPQMVGRLLDVVEAARKFSDDGDSCITYPPCGDCRYCALDAALGALDGERTEVTP